MDRPNVHEYFMEMAELAASRSTCLRRSVGAVIVRDKQMISTGYNGAPKGLPHSEEVGCLREEQDIPSGTRHELCRGVHAEQNAVIQAAVFGVSVEGGTLYSTHHPCVLCVKILINAGIKEVIYKEGYPDDLSKEMIKESDMKVNSYEKKLKEYEDEQEEEKQREEKQREEKQEDLSEGTDEEDHGEKQHY